MIVDLGVRGLQRDAATDLSDLTLAAPTGAPRWARDGHLEIPFEVDPTPAEVRLIRRRLITATNAEEALVTSLVASRDELAATTNTGPTMRAVRTLLDIALAPYGETAPPTISGGAP